MTRKRAVDVGLTEVLVADLEAMVEAIRRGELSVPITKAALAAAGLSHLHGRLSILDGFGPHETSAAVLAVIAERRVRSSQRVELVWTGPEPLGSASRDTAVVVQELFAGAQKDVLVAGIYFDHAQDILAPLHAGMRDRGVRAEIFLDIPGESPTVDGIGAFAAQEGEAFLRRNWPFGEPRPTLYYDPRTADPRVYVSLHAKCIVVDEHTALVTSANFTSRGQTRNIEVGALIHDDAFAAALVRQWRGAVDAGLMKRLP